MIKDSGIYYEPAKLNSSENISFDEQKFYTFNLTSSPHSRLNPHNNTKYKEHPNTFHTSELLAAQDAINENSNFSHKYKRRIDLLQNKGIETNGDPLYLYLDIDLRTSEKSNQTQLERVKNMFENFQTSENDLSECINLHIYIFSKYIDTINKTNTNWGHKVEHDNLSSSEELTEIQKKCGQPANIIKQSIYEIKQNFPQKEQTSQTEQVEQIDENNESISPNKYIVPQSESRNIENTTTLSDLYTTLTTFADNDVKSKTNILSGNIEVQLQSDKQYTEHDALNSFGNNNQSHDPNSAFTLNSPILNEKKLLNITKHITIEEAIAAGVTQLSVNENLTTRETNRVVYGEEEIQIPRIITKEFPNGTFLSVIDGHEEIPNSDFNTNGYTIPKDADESTISYFRDNLNDLTTNPDLLLANNNNIMKSDFVELQGNLYFLFGKKQIPARFIQQPDGELNVAIDGFSLCGQMLEENTSKFMNLLCNCLQLQNCTNPSP